MKGEWCYFKSYIDKQTCEDIIANAKQLQFQDALVGLNEGGTDNNSRRSKIAFIDKGDWRFQNVYDILWKTLIEANNDFFNIHVTKLDFVQFAEYDSSYKGEYKEHHDVFWLNNDPYNHRKISCVIQLSDPNDYTGGNFEITDVSIPPDPNELRDQGSIIFFPSLFRHKANPVLSGTRYSIAAWFEGPKWR
jgi:PKHD-type hydroxylase